MTSYLQTGAINLSGPRHEGDRSVITSAGVAIILLGVGAAVPPALKHVPAAWTLGLLFVAAGLIELLAGSRRNETKFLAMLAGFATFAVGTLPIVNRTAGILPNATVITAWLLTRAAILFADEPVGAWFGEEVPGDRRNNRSSSRRGIVRRAFSFDP